MSIVHSKVSGQANTDAGKVGGADWDHHHLHGPGDIFMVGLAKFSADPTLGVDTATPYLAGAITGITYDAGDLRVGIQLPYTMVSESPVIFPDCPVVPGSTVDYFIDFSYRSALFCPQTLSERGMDQFGNMSYDIQPFNSANAMFSQPVEIVAKLYAIVS
jgi:hypothetical protein